ncbi:hypothetical protein KFE25_001508 [Diacronema lutheri]|uniref:Autophagy protein 5 n=1 Tax=Diacronema lutheri TaxID=2081491 RepID=A0A8J5X1A7_DIALT|nr:hypothetical protein KFE25_001508 [Diacronema lutheri]
MEADVGRIQRAVWEGRVPAVITLARDELTTLEQPRELYLMLPRQGYLPYAATREVYDHFGAHAPPCPGEVWFEASGVPLRWTVPIGVLFDLHAPTSAAERLLPWRLVAHFSNFPAAAVLRGGGARDMTAVAAHYMNALKQSTYLRCGSTQPVMSLSTDAQRTLQRSIEAGRYADYVAVQAQLSPPQSMTNERRRKARVAVRIHRDAGAWLQPALSALHDDGHARSLASVLSCALPGEFGGCEAEAEAEAATRTVLIHGVPAPLRAPIDWLCAACAHPDGFLHVVLHARAPTAARAAGGAAAQGAAGPDHGVEAGC